MSKPPKFQPGEFTQLVDDYLDDCAAERDIPTKMHFAMRIGISREQLYKYYGVKEEYSEAYSKLDTAHAGMMEYCALNPKEGDNRNAGVMVFGLKNIGWTDKQEIDHRSSDGSMRPTTIQLVGPDDCSED